MQEATSCTQGNAQEKGAIDSTWVVKIQCGWEIHQCTNDMEEYLFTHREYCKQQAANIQGGNHPWIKIQNLFEENDWQLICYNTKKERPFTCGSMSHDKLYEVSFIFTLVERG